MKNIILVDLLKYSTKKNANGNLKNRRDTPWLCLEVSRINEDKDILNVKWAIKIMERNIFDKTSRQWQLLTNKINQKKMNNIKVKRANLD